MVGAHQVSWAILLRLVASSTGEEHNGSDPPSRNGWVVLVNGTMVKQLLSHRNRQSTRSCEAAQFVRRFFRSRNAWGAEVLRWSTQGSESFVFDRLRAVKSRIRRIKRSIVYDPNNGTIWGKWTLTDRKQVIKSVRFLAPPCITSYWRWQVSPKPQLVWFFFHNRKRLFNLGGTAKDFGLYPTLVATSYHWSGSYL